MRRPSKIPDGNGDDRAARLAEALRDNLRRRKTQERARKAAVRTGDGGEAGGGEWARGGAEDGPDDGAGNGREDRRNGWRDD